MKIHGLKKVSNIDDDHDLLNHDYESSYPCKLAKSKSPKQTLAGRGAHTGT